MARLVLQGAIAAGMGCAGKPAAPPRDGTARMADTLAVLSAHARANPSANPFLSRERADAMQAQLAALSGSQAITARYHLAQARLMAGQTRDAIADIERLLIETGLTSAQMSPESKPLFELRALAYLRLGEQENCQANPAANVCILPLEGGARHLREEGARTAIDRYTEILQRFPEDHGSRWLLNLAWLAIGRYPDSVPARYRIPGLSSRAGARFPMFPNVAGDVGLAVTGLAGGVSVEDFNGDGLFDVFTTSWGLGDPVHLLLADGTGRFEDRTEQSGLEGIVGGLNTVHADYDNDGDADILVLRGAWLGPAGNYPNSLLRNRGDGTFEDVTFDAGLLSFHPTQTAAWADFNLDGYLDLFIGNESMAPEGGASHPSELYLNDGRGHFRDVAAQVGIGLDDFVKAVVWGDVNNDGLPDLFASVLQGRNRLYVNRGGPSVEAWRFEEQAAGTGVELPIASFPSWFWDFDQDGWEDLLVLSYDLRSTPALNEAVAREYLRLPVRAEPSRLFRNNGDGTFADVTRAVGLEGKVIYAMGSNFGDLDNDGWLDFYVGTGNPDLRSVIPNRMFRSVEGRRFEEVTLSGGFGHLQKGHATAFVDLDRDGDEDVFMVLGGAYPGDRFTSVLFENPGWPHHAWISLALEGKTANRSAIGARIELDVTDAQGRSRTLHRTVRTGGSFGAGSLTQHIGLGPATRVRALRIRWPDAARTLQSVGSLEINQAYRIIQGTPPTAAASTPVPFRKVPVGSPPAHAHR